MKKISLCILLLFSFSINAQDINKVVANANELIKVNVDSVVVPTSVEQIIELLKNYQGNISIGGARYSMGGQIAFEKSLHLDMRSMNKMISFSKDQKEIRVQAGTTWRQIQEKIDSFNLSIKIMQSYSNFTVGGSLSVNVHGRYLGLGPIINSVKSIQIILANGDKVEASLTENKELFCAAIGGYGAIGVITEVTLLLDDNCQIERLDELMSLSDYFEYFKCHIDGDSSIVFHNAVWYPNSYNKVRAVSYRKTSEEVNLKDRLVPKNKSYFFDRILLQFVASSDLGKFARRYVFDPILFQKKIVEWRNYEASYDAAELHLKSQNHADFILQEYFVPVDQMNVFCSAMSNIIKANDLNVINISIRHSPKDTLSTLAWAKSEVFTFVLFITQNNSAKGLERVCLAEKELIYSAIMCGGSYYLPYQLNATSQQFKLAYPNSKKFIEIKLKYDPQNRFRNQLVDKYLR